MTNCEPQAATIVQLKGCSSAILFRSGLLQHLCDALSIDILLDLLHNVSST